MSLVDDTTDYDTVDEGMRDTVRWLRECGYNVTDHSGWGGKFGQPTVWIWCQSDEANDRSDDLLKLLKDHGIPCGLKTNDPEQVFIQASYTPASGIALIAVVWLDDEMLAAANGVACDA